MSGNDRTVMDSRKTVEWLCRACGFRWTAKHWPHRRHPPGCSECNNADVRAENGRYAAEECEARPGGGKGWSS